MDPIISYVLRLFLLTMVFLLLKSFIEFINRLSGITSPQPESMDDELEQAFHGDDETREGIELQNMHLH